MVKKKTKKNSLIIYTDSKCPICHETRMYLDKKNISYKEVNLDEHPELNIPFAPIICKVGKGKSKCLMGFNEKNIDKLIKKSKKKGKI